MTNQNKPNRNKTLTQLRADVSVNFPEIVESVEQVVENRLSHVALDLYDLSSYLRIQASRIKPYREIK